MTESARRALNVLSSPRFVRRNAAFFLPTRRVAPSKKREQTLKTERRTTKNDVERRLNRSTTIDKPPTRRRRRRYIFWSLSILNEEKKVFLKFSPFERKSVGLRVPLLAENEKKWKMNRIDAGNFSRRFVDFSKRPNVVATERGAPAFARETLSNEARLKVGKDARLSGRF